jgi:cell division protein ZapA
MEKTAVTVKIFNEEYTLKTDLPRADVDAIAAMVDQKMQKLATSQHLVKVAVWAALDLAGELYTLRREYEALLKAAKDI